MSVVIGVVVVLLVLLVLVLSSSVKVLREYERGVIFRLGRLKGGASGPGLFLLIPVIDRIVRIDLRIVTLQVPPQDIISKDNVPVRVTAVVYFRIVDPRAAVVAIENYLVGTSQIAQTTLRSVLGQHTLDELLAERDRINEILQGIIDQQTEPWGVKVTVVEVKDVELPQGMQRAMARQAEAERERRAKIIGAEGEFEASEKLAQAAQVLSRDPAALQLRYLQTLLEISSGSNNTSTTIFPIPIDLLRPFADAAQRYADGGGAPPAAPADRPPAAPTRRGRSEARSRLGDPGRRRARAGTPPGRVRAGRPTRAPADAGRVPVLCGPRGSDASGDARAPGRRRRLGGAGRAEPVPGARAAGRRERGRDPHAGAHDRVRRARAAGRRADLRGVGEPRRRASRWRPALAAVLDQRRARLRGVARSHALAADGDVVRAAARRGARLRRFRRRLPGLRRARREATPAR